MKPGVSSLNPYAASYIPLAKRGANDNAISIDVNQGNETAWFETSSHSGHHAIYDNASLHSVTHGTEKHRVTEASALKSRPGYGSLVQNLDEMADNQILDEESDMDLEYLRMTFPGLSNESLLDVYVANNGDLEATIDMLNQLEMYPVESSETLPDTLDIGDVSESGSLATCGALKLKNVAGETNASSSGAVESSAT
ncbi:hypothetical protein PTKIN_Ptkin03bG0149600 [Pterospermum kingtungense]